jgi:transcriptional regulator with XRE-family HTH domain
MAVVPNDKLKRARESRGWSQSRAAQYLQGITVKSLSDWEQGRKPSERNINRLCALFRRTRQELGF